MEQKDNLKGNSLVSVILVTHNRKELLSQAIKAVQMQSIPVEIIVMDDASDDGTDEMINNNFLGIIYRKSKKNFGPSYQRNEGAKLATSDVIFFLDDDTVYQDAYTIEKTIFNFDQPYIGAVTMPFINILQNDSVWNGSPNERNVYIYHSFVAAAFAVRKDLFIKLGGFREAYFYMGEEGDFCLRLLKAGFFVRAGTCKPAFHHQPANRVSFNADYYGRRNDILFLYLNSPKRYMILYLFLTIVKGLLFGIRVRRLKNMYRGLAAGLKLLFAPHIKTLKHPVNMNTFIKFRYIKKNEPVTIEQLL